ncbi:hypothetical protein CC80DRAFT_470544 [Byssothecium circinans]|uniref:DUF7703 domain-containing protein n=1 Tax=Byssothecium circinans TaxID=147558 RepID=A0A6A5U063_9PLEO|nr:hypothetical protein CC80DRAFT_470544 [Byssothecium circinans]
MSRAMMAFTAITWYNSIETLVLIFIYFKMYTGLYFWRLLLSTAAVLPFATGGWMKQHEISHSHPLDEALLIIGWLIMVPGQSLVLCSRLHILSQDTVLLHFVLWLIIFNSIVLCIPTIVLDSLQFSTTHLPIYVHGYFVMEKIGMSLFTAQGVFISGVYFWEVRKLLNVRRVLDSEMRKLIWQLLAMHILHLTMDIGLLTVEFLEMYQIQTTLKGLVFSVKLEI